MTPTDSLPPEDAVEQVLRGLFAPGDWRPDGLWYRVWMNRLAASTQSERILRAGWKLHLSSTPVQLPYLAAKALPCLRSLGFPFKMLRTPSLLERMNDGRLGLFQVGKAVTVYPPSESSAAEAAALLAAALRGMDGPHVPTDFRFSENAPVYFRFGPFDGRFIVDISGQKRRIVLHPELGEIIDDPAMEQHPKPAHLPIREPYDHLHFLRDDFRFVRFLQISAKGATLVAMHRTDADRPLLIKTAKRGTHSDLLGRDALWGLRREHEFLGRLAGCPGIPSPGELRLDGNEVAALVRPYVEGRTL
ncbi:MAG: hypothetical protein HYZ00_06215, partial [Candidatus Hydrogenedentes bacterium]|nr:hypothetical protein [Candidatus Hydrogenedentota bacterium]